MRQFILKGSLFTFLSLLLAISTAIADEEITIDTDEKAKEFLMGYNWEFEWEQPGYKGTSKVVYEEASLKKVTGKTQNSYCPDGWGKVKGKFKKGKFKGKTSGLPSPCQGTSNDTGVSLVKKADGTLHSTGVYNMSYGAKGKTKCVATPK